MATQPGSMTMSVGRIHRTLLLNGLISLYADYIIVSSKDLTFKNATMKKCHHWCRMKGVES